MDKLYDYVTTLTGELSKRVQGISDDKSLDDNTKYIKTQTYGEIIDLITDLTNKTIRGGH